MIGAATSAGAPLSSAPCERLGNARCMGHCRSPYGCPATRWRSYLLIGLAPMLEMIASQPHTIRRHRSGRRSSGTCIMGEFLSMPVFSASVGEILQVFDTREIPATLPIVLLHNSPPATLRRRPAPPGRSCRILSCFFRRQVPVRGPAASGGWGL